MPRHNFVSIKVGYEIEYLIKNSYTEKFIEGLSKICDYSYLGDVIALFLPKKLDLLKKEHPVFEIDIEPSLATRHYVVLKTVPIEIRPKQPLYLEKVYESFEDLESLLKK